MSKTKYRTECLGCGEEFEIEVEDAAGAVGEGICGACGRKQSVRLVTRQETNVNLTWITFLSFYRRFVSPACA